MATRNDRLQCTWMTSFSIVHTWNCMHVLVILSLKTVSNIEEQLCIVCMYTGNLSIISTISQIWKWFKNVYISFDLKCICVWCLDNWSRILPINTFSMASLKTVQFRLTLTPHFTATHAFFSLFHHFFSWSAIGVVGVSSAVVFFFFILVTFDLCLLLIHRDSWHSQKWQILISNLQYLPQYPLIVFWIFFYFLRFVTRNPHPHLFFFFFFFFWKFSPMEKVFKMPPS
jgi:hypothetical protein